MDHVQIFTTSALGQFFVVPVGVETLDMPDRLKNTIPPPDLPLNQRHSRVPRAFLAHFARPRTRDCP